MKKYLFVALILITSVAIFHKGKVLGTSDEMPVVHGIIVPHHDLADELLISSFQSLRESYSYETIYILGPNHFYPESELVITATEIAEYPLNLNRIQDLDSAFSEVTLNNELVSHEHSIQIPLKYLAEIFPDAQFVPLVISPYYQDKQIDELSDFLARDDSALFVLAVDFAHNVGMEEGLQQNIQSIEAIEHFDYDTILNFTDHNLDSPVATALFLNVMQRIHSTEWSLYQSTHGSVIEGIPDLEGTSYVVGTFSN